MRIYLAGPDVFVPDAIAHGAKLKALCAKHDAQGLFPMDQEISDVERGTWEQAMAIRQANMDLIRQCEAVVANMTPFRSPSMDPGTAYEMGVAAAWGKVVIGYTTDVRSYTGKVCEVMSCVRDSEGQLRDHNNLAVEEFQHHGTGLIDNLMMCCGVDAMASTPEQAIITAVRMYHKKSSTA